MNSYDFNGRVAIITGAGQGIGLTVAERMLDSGASVSIWDRDQKLLDALDAKTASPARCRRSTSDIGKLESVETATKAVHRAGSEDRHPDQQRRDRRARISHLGISAAGVRGRGADRAGRHVLRLPGCRAAHDRSRLRAHRQPRLDRRQGRQSQRPRLFVDEGGRHRRSPSRWARSSPSTTSRSIA